MPLAAQVAVRAALIWLGLGALAGGLLLAAASVPGLGWAGALRVGHMHALLAGWLGQLAVGVAYWMLPRHDAAGGRGPAWPIWLFIGALNAGLALVAIGAALPAAWGWPAALRLLGGALEAAAGPAALAALWGRALPFRTLPRPGG